jgi:hypothetical protein
MIGIIVPAVQLTSLPVLDSENFKCLICVAQWVHYRETLSHLTPTIKNILAFGKC